MASLLTAFGRIDQLSLAQGESKLATCIASVSLTHFEALKTRNTEFLSPEELSYFEGRQFERKQKSYLSGRFAAKLALGSYLPESRWTAIDIYPGVFEQPLVRYQAQEIPGVSITHCSDLAMALAFPLTHPMGIDVEIIDQGMVDTMKTQMCASEIEWAQNDAANRYALIWTAKEALSKALKCGFTTSFELLEVENWVETGGVWQGTFRNFRQYRCYSWLTNRHALSITVPMQLALPPTADLRPLLT